MGRVGTLTMKRQQVLPRRPLRSRRLSHEQVPQQRRRPLSKKLLRMPESFDVLVNVTLMCQQLAEEFPDLLG